MGAKFIAKTISDGRLHIEEKQITFHVHIYGLPYHALPSVVGLSYGLYAKETLPIFCNIYNLGAKYSVKTFLDCYFRFKVMQVVVSVRIHYLHYHTLSCILLYICKGNLTFLFMSFLEHSLLNAFASYDKTAQH